MTNEMKAREKNVEKRVGFNQRLHKKQADTSTSTRFWRR